MEERASILLEALPYIQRFYGKTLVIKLGGTLLEDEELKDSIYQDIVLLNYVGMKPTIVHGGGTEISKEMEKAGKKPEFIEGLRVTDEETMEILHKSLGGKINKEIVLGLNKHGGHAIGVSGMDGGLVQAKKIESKSGEDLGFVGEVEEINPSITQYLLDEDYIPVIAPIGADKEGNSLNLNADIVAAELAPSLEAEKLILLTDVPGVLEDPNDEDSLISSLTLEEAQKLVEDEKITEGMIPKVQACVKCVESGVERAHIINGETPHSLLLELLTEGGIGTMIERG
ncbi:acetylglutamate kinase [candidate division MSBL1 archaeon SCGC-AAA261O19]|uniref:Acetylglutamate kinase n=2 Tax=candidate division MSBL1 TaxID=215777 RepID=A0A133UZF7_9EURY|nr:acetylglutamate kinase [candidate division MSBL1 archaeon SCGC-AAA261C02]KXB04329.1 acetylglutamate kinase [candidate division MSBL1 archaeon SCGC-AAA261O19]